MRWITVMIASVTACGSPVAPTPPHPVTLADLGWLIGPRGDSGWQSVATTLYGVVLRDDGFEVTIVDDSDDDGKPAPIAAQILDGKTEVRLGLVSATAETIVFAAPDRTLSFHKTAARASFPAAPELEAADLQFAADSAKEGGDAWVRWFGSDGVMWRSKPVTGDAIGTTIGKTLSRGALVWHPAASGRRGDWGFTVGTWEFGPAGGAHGSYCTVWHRAASGWQVAFDVGRTANQ